MKIFKIFILAIVTGLFITACTVEQTIDFNKNLSGNMTLQINMEDMLKELKKIQPDTAKTNTDLLKETETSESLLELKKEFEQTEGISNFKAIEDYDKGILGFSFNFEDIENINKGMEGQSEKSNGLSKENVKLFTISKNKLTIDFGNEKEETSDEENLMASFDMGEYILTLNFPFPVKKVSNNLYTLSKDRKQVQLNIELTEMIKDFGQLKTDIVW